jgi:NAD(P)H dehydrogenase (quinone)
MTDKTELFLITGATGKTGAPTVGLLREQGFRVRAFVHALDERATRLDAQGAEVVHGDLLDFDAVSSAMVGVTGAYFCFPPDPPRLLEAAAIFAQAASEAGVRAVVNMSQISARRDTYPGAREHWIAERLLEPA